MVQFAERAVTYDFAGLAEIALALAVTCTRAKRLALLVGPTKAIGMSIKRVTDQKRYTALADQLRSFSNASAR